LILYFFYKNIVFTLPQIFYAFVNGYSGQTVYDDWYISFYNMVFTALPLMAKALFEQDVNPSIDGEGYKKFFPRLFYIGQRSLIFNTKNYAIWLVEGVFHSLIVFILPFFIYKRALLTDDSYNNDLWSFSISSFTAVIFIVTLKLMVFERFFTWINLFCIIVLSVGLYFAYIWGSNGSTYSLPHYSMETIFSSAHLYLSCALCVVLAYVVDIFKASYIFNFKTTPTDFLRQKIKDKANPDDFEEEFEEVYQQVAEKFVEEDLMREMLNE